MFTVSGLLSRRTLSLSLSVLLVLSVFLPLFPHPMFVQTAHAAPFDPARSAGWISTSYNSMNSPSTFASFGSEQQNPESTYSVTFSQIGVAGGDSWGVTVGGAHYPASGSSVSCFWFVWRS